MTAITQSSDSQLINNYINNQKKIEAENAPKKDKAKSDLIGSYDTFLKILTAQISNQDPTEPMKASEFTNQLVQYSAVEQQINTNEKLDQMLLNQNSNGITPLLSYVGRFAEVAEKDKLVVQNGKAMMSYNLPVGVSLVDISVQDANGNVVATIHGPTETGINRVAWNGQMTNGQTAPDGVYKYVLTAKNSSGDVQKIEDVRVIGQVTGVETDANGKISLKIGDLFVDDKNIKSVFANIGLADNEEQT